MREYTTVAGPAETELEIKRSRFLCALAPVSTEDEARAFIGERARLHPKGRHHCTAFVLGADATVQRSNDDGEPSGTAGRPMLEVLTGHGLSDVVAVVTRYFGGVLLGAGGLARAYGNAVSATVAVAETVQYAARREVRVTLSYQHGPAFEAECHTLGWPVLETVYGEQVTITFAVAQAEVEQAVSRLADLSSGEAVPEILGERYVRV